MNHLPQHKVAATHRYAWTLLEVLVAMAVGSVVFGIAVVTVAMLLELQRDVSEQQLFAATRARLAAQFREDARRATDWTSGTNGSGWSFQQPADAETKYEIQGSALIWTRSRQGMAESRQRFVQPPGTEYFVSDAESDHGGRRLIQLDVRYPVAELPLASKRHQVIGRLGSDLRYGVSALSNQ
jgi:prepilin-type N-terminal cleavage/methylation domain-containing protein